MLAVLDWLTGPLTTVGAQPVTIAASIGCLAYLAALVAAARGSRVVWPVAAVIALAFAGLALATGMWADAAIRVVFALLCAYGWRQRRRNPHGAVRHAEGREVAYGVVLFAIVTVVAAYALTDQSASAVPWGAAVVSAAVLVQLVALARGLVVGWWVALGGAVVTFGLAVATASWATGVTAIAVGAAAVYGWLRWRKELPARVALVAPLPDGVDEDVAA